MERPTVTPVSSVTRLACVEPMRAVLYGIDRVRPPPAGQGRHTEGRQGEARRINRRWPILGTKKPLWDLAEGASDGSPTQEGRQSTRVLETLAPELRADLAWIDRACALPGVLLGHLALPTDLQP